MSEVRSMSQSQKKSNEKNHEQRFVKKYLKRMEKNRQRETDDDERPKEWYDFYSRTDEVIVPSKWVTRLDEANAVHNQLRYLREKLDADLPREEKKIDRESLYCSSALHKMRQNAFHQRLDEHQQRWHSIVLIGELAAELPKPTTDPAEIERRLYQSLLNKK